MQIGKILLFSLVCCFLSCCRSGDKKKVAETSLELPKALATPKGFEMPNKKLFLFRGSAQKPAFSPTGNKFLFLLKNNENHKQTEIYEFDFKTESFTRLTHQSGEIYSFHYGRDEDSFYYSSSTDEEKEHPDLIKSFSQVTNKRPEIFSEMYKAKAFGRNIQRITNERGFDGDSDLHPQKNLLIFVRKGNLYQFANRKTTLYKRGNFRSPSFSPTGTELAMIEEGPKDQRILLGEFRKKTFTAYSPFRKAKYKDIAWHPNSKEIFFSARQEDIPNWEIYSMNIENTCIKRLSYHEADDSQVSIHPNGKELLFMSTRSGISQIYQMPIKAPKDCLLFANQKLPDVYSNPWQKYLER